MAANHMYGPKSQQKLNSCHDHLEQIAQRALTMCPYDITIIHGWRGKEIQNALEESGASTKRFPDSRHNKTDDPTVVNPNEVSDALDFAPWVDGGIPWKDTHIFACIAGCFFAAAAELGYKIRWGGDWDSDGDTSDQTLMDWGHVEIVHHS